MGRGNIFVTIGARLREERERLGLSQQAFASIGNVTKQTQITWEKAEQFPNAAFLAAIDGAGADVLYIVTGRRTKAAEPGVDIDRYLLRTVITTVEEEFKRRDLRLPPAKKAALILALHDTCKASSEGVAPVVERHMRLVA